MIDPLDLANDIPVPACFRLKAERMPGFIGSDKVNIFRLQEAVLVSVYEPGMEGEGQIIAILSVLHISRVKRVAVAEQSFALF